MRIHRQGYASIILSFFVSITLIIAGNAIGVQVISYVFYLAAIFLMAAVLHFFRKPNRPTVEVDEFVISPADGKVVSIERVLEEEYFNSHMIVISIFMSPLDVHINWSPVKGEVVYNQYHKGSHLVAWHPKSSIQNERNTLVIRGLNNDEIMVRQIAGAMARRIVHFKSKGMNVRQAEEIGFIKFGSRVDLFLPEHYKVKVNLGDGVIGSQSIIAEKN
jgi:phosphatidylserine decarboxylase